MDLQLGAVREAIAAGAPSGVTGHARPPGLVASFPALIVGDPQEITYQSSYCGRPVVVLPVRLIVPRAAEQNDAAQLDALVSTLPDLLAAISSELWSELNVTGMAGGYFDWLQGGKVIGLGADLTTEIVIKRNEA
jgi:hypothetical protein